MRTLYIILGGFLLWGLCLGVGKLLVGRFPAAITVATALFVLAWFLAAAANMWIGVTEAGYTVKEELPIFLLIFLLPAAAAVLVRWKFFQPGS